MFFLVALDTLFVLTATVSYGDFEQAIQSKIILTLCLSKTNQSITCEYLVINQLGLETSNSNKAGDTRSGSFFAVSDVFVSQLS